MSDSSRPHGLQPTRLLCPWDFPGKSAGVGCHCLLRGKEISRLKKEIQTCFLLSVSCSYRFHNSNKCARRQWLLISVTAVGFNFHVWFWFLFVFFFFFFRRPDSGILGPLSYLLSQAPSLEIHVLIPTDLSFSLKILKDSVDLFFRDLSPRPLGPLLQNILFFWFPRALGTEL